jgi:adenylate cyclase
VPQFVLYAVIVLACGACAGLAVYMRRSGKLSRLFLALPPQSRAALIRRPSLLHTKGETRAITYLSCRVANLPEIEQRFHERPAQMIRLFEKRLGALYRAVLEEGGTVERFGAAGFAAYWNAPLGDAHHAPHAAAAAASQMAIVREQNIRPMRPGASAPPPLQLVIGLATGCAAAGLFGGLYSVSGACVTRAEALREACMDYGFCALADAETAAQTAERFALLEIDRPAGGSRDTAAIYALLGDQGVRASPTFRAAETFHARIFAAFGAQDHDGARALIAQAAKLSGASAKLYDLYLARDPRTPFRQAS